jgi:hypothetical protein
MNAPDKNRVKALAAWGERAPDWVLALAAECDRTSQGRAARRLGISAAVVNQLLRGRYEGNVARMEERVRGELMRATCTCPVLGEISTRRCQDEQAAPFSVSSRLRVAIYRACRSGCPNYKGGNS